MKRTAEKYGGSLFLEDKGDLFETKLMLTGIAMKVTTSVLLQITSELLQMPCK